MGTPHAPVQELIIAAEQRGYPVISAAAGDPQAADFLQDGEAAAATLPWRMGSTLSARSLVASAQETARAHGGRLDTAVIVFTPPQENRGFHVIPPGDLDADVQTFFAGTLFLVRELLAAFTAAGGGTITIILDEHNQGVLSPLGAGVLYGVQRLVEGLFHSYREESVVIQGIRSSMDQPEALARFFYDDYLARADKNEYRWVKFSGRSGLFGKKGVI